jgi:hypothetical protein
MKAKLNYTTAIICITITLCSFSMPKKNSRNHAPIVKTYEKNKAGKEVIKTQITLDKHTSRDALIETCGLLSKEDVALTFASLSIRKSFLGIAGKNRIAKLKGQIKLPDGKIEKFTAGGVFNFRVVRITYIQIKGTDTYTINMIEVID